MAGPFKEAKRGLRKKSAAALHAIVHRSPSWLQRPLAPLFCHAEMLILDYGLARIFYHNRHKISDDAWRSAQPAPRHIGAAARRGVKTVINLRSDQSFGTHWLEETACKHHGLKLVHVALRSRSAPTREDLRAAKTLLENAEYPVLIHCKSGADRAGLMSALYKIVKENAPVADAKNQLALKFGHVRQADTGVLDYFFERYLDANAKSPVAFWDWVENHYDQAEVMRSFKAKGWANRLVNDLWHRE